MTKLFYELILLGYCQKLSTKRTPFIICERVCGLLLYIKACIGVFHSINLLLYLKNYLILLLWRVGILRDCTICNIPAILQLYLVHFYKGVSCANAADARTGGYFPYCRALHSTFIQTCYETINCLLCLRRSPWFT